MPNHVTTRCIISGSAEELASFRAKMLRVVKGEDGEETIFDFNRLIPMPDALDGTSSPNYDAKYGWVLSQIQGSPFPKAKEALPGLALLLGHESGMDPLEAKVRQEVGLEDASIPPQQVALAFLEKHPETTRKGLDYLQVLEQTGYDNWYDWKVANWGTKWGAYSFRLASETPDRLEFVFDTAWSFPEPIFEKLAENYQNLHFFCACFDEGRGFSGRGYYNPPSGEAPFGIDDADDETYELVYGEPPNAEEYLEDEDEGGPAHEEVQDPEDPDGADQPGEATPPAEQGDAPGEPDASSDENDQSISMKA